MHLRSKCWNITIRLRMKHLPILVAPASILFSTSSLTAVARVSTTWPEHIRCTEVRSMALIEEAGPGEYEL